MSDEPKVTTKRFIAGAVCPACSATDSIKMWDVDGVPHRECVECGYADTLRGNQCRLSWVRGSTRPSRKPPIRRCRRCSFSPIRS